jgi:hypothetical protein
LSLDIHAPIEIEWGKDVSAGALDSPVQVLLTYQQLLNLFLAGSEGPTKAVRLWAFNKWIDFVGTGPTEQPGAELAVDFENTLTRVRNEMAETKASRTAANFSSCIRMMQGVYVRHQQTAELPLNFLEAIRLRLKVLGLKPNSLRKAGWASSVYTWCLGTSEPNNSKKALNNLYQLEEFLQLPKNSLVERCPNLSHVATPVRRLNSDVPYRRYASIVSAHRIVLLLKDTPEPLRAALDAIVIHKQRDDHELPNGDYAALNPAEYWSSDATVGLVLERFGRFFGFLSAPKATKPLKDLPWEEQIDCGLGIPKDELRITMLCNKDYLRAYLEFSQLRTFDEAAFLYEEARQSGRVSLGPVPTRKTLPVSVIAFLQSSKNLVGKPTSFFRLHPEYSNEVGVPSEQWTSWCVSRHDEMKKIVVQAEKKVQKGKRSTEGLVKELLREKNPVEAIYEMLKAMRETIPSHLKPVKKLLHFRNIAIFSFLLFDPIRLKNLHQLELGTNIFQNEEGQWIFALDARLTKNFKHGHAEDRYRVIPPDVAQDLVNWIELRRTLPGIDQTTQLFVRGMLGGRNSTHSYVSTPQTITQAIKKCTGTYLGLSIGPHVMRHLEATTIGRYGTPKQVKAILNDSMAVAMDVYDHARNVDEMDGLDNLYNKLNPANQSKRGAK